MYEDQFAVATTSPAMARAFVKRQLTHHDLLHLVDDICLVVSELVTNAVIHASAPVCVRIEALLHCVMLTVSDGSADLPVLWLERRVPNEADGGRGLWLIEAVSSDWGTDLGRSGGKSTWAQFGVSP
jgi:anti-sigma regulatory factor (Ser/Thr protein kinase)